MSLKVTLAKDKWSSEKGEPVTIHAPDHTFKSGTTGYYFRERVLIDGESHHVQIIISKK